MMKKIALTACLLLALPAQAQLLSFLVSQWIENGNQMCKYDNGTVLNVGARVCPLSIRA
jgi:hypothetical protein